VFRVQGPGFRVQGSGFRVQGSGFKVMVESESFATRLTQETHPGHGASTISSHSGDRTLTLPFEGPSPSNLGENKQLWAKE